MRRVGAVLVALCLGCTGPEQGRPQDGRGGKRVYADDFVLVTRFVDEEYGVVCYATGSGISCLNTNRRVE